MEYHETDAHVGAFRDVANGDRTQPTATGELVRRVDDLFAPERLGDLGTRHDWRKGRACSHAHGRTINVLNARSTRNGPRWYFVPCAAIRKRYIWADRTENS